MIYGFPSVKHHGRERHGHSSSSSDSHSWSRSESESHSSEEPDFDEQRMPRHGYRKVKCKIDNMMPAYDTVN